MRIFLLSIIALFGFSCDNPAKPEPCILDITDTCCLEDDMGCNGMCYYIGECED